jgi:cathepsin D
VYTEAFTIPVFPADGLLGLGFQSISALNARPVFQTLITENALDNSTFALKLNASTDSECYIGGVNKTLYTGDFTWVSLTTVVCYTHYSVNVDANMTIFARVSGKRPCKAFL